jgi:hypothetical protein
MKGMLDWAKIDSDRTFQRLVNHLFAVECNSPGFIPSSPYIGADGGWDGYYLGEYPPEHEKDKWSIQAKWTTKSFEIAMPYLKQQVKKELQNAKKNQANHLRIATNAELKVNQVLELEGLKRNEVTTLRVWHREALTLRIERQPFVRYFFFGLPRYPMLVPSNVYFNEIEHHLLPVSVSKIRKFEDYMHQAEQFIRSKSKSILIVHSPGGYGKSHLLKEISEIVHRVDLQKQCWMIRAGHRKVEDAIQDEIVNEREYVVILDDADRYLESVKPLLSLTKFKGNRFKLILAMRSSGFNHIFNLINELRCEELQEEIKISDWLKDDLVQLLRIASGLQTVEDEDLIVSKYCNPFLIVWIGKRIKQEPTLDITDIKQKFVGDIRCEAKKCLEGIIDSAMLDEFLTNLASVVPFSKDDRTILNVLREQTKSEMLMEAIDTFRKVGILRLVGNSVRFNPDMMGDLYLAYRLEDLADLQKLEQLIERWLAISAEKLFINLEAALRYTNRTHIKTILSKILSSWVVDAERTPGDVRIERLNLIENMARIIPKECLDLMYAYLDSEAPPSNNVYLKAWGGCRLQANSDHYGPVLVKMQRIPEVRKELTEIIEQLETKKLMGTYSNYKPGSLIEALLSPLHNSWKLISATLGILQQWVEQPTNVRITLASAGLSGVLGASHERTTYGFGSVTWQEICIVPSAEANAIRDTALNVLKSMLRHPSLEVKLAAVDVAQQIGRSIMGHVVETDVPLATKVSRERKEIVKELSNLVFPEADFSLLSAIEDAFLKWWAQQKGGADEVEGHLSKFPRSPEYLVFRCFVAPEYVVKDFDSLKAQAPEKGRWSWFMDHVYKHNDLLTHQPESFRDLAEPLNNKFKTRDAVAKYLEKLEEQISPYDPWAHPLIIACWVKMNVPLFLSVWKGAALWSRVPQRFQREIELSLSDFNQEIISEKTHSVLSRLPNVTLYEVSTLLQLIERRSLSEVTIDSCLSEVLDKGTSEIQAMVVHDLYFVFKKTQNLLLTVKLLSLAVSKETILDKKMASSLGFVICSLRNQLGELGGEPIDDLRRKLAEKVKDISHIDWDSERLMDFALDDLFSFIDLIEYRLRRSREIREKGTIKEGYQAIPYGGIECIKKQIKSFSDFEKLIQKVAAWGDEDAFAKDFDLKYLISPLTSLRDTSSGKLYLQSYIEKQLEEDRLETALATSWFLPLSEETVDLFVSVGETAIAKGFVRETDVLFYNKSLPNSWSSTPGEPPPIFIERKNLFEKMYQTAKPGKLKMLFFSCIETIDRKINDLAKQDEEFLNPK